MKRILLLGSLFIIQVPMHGMELTPLTKESIRTAATNYLRTERAIELYLSQFRNNNPSLSDRSDDLLKRRIISQIISGDLVLNNQGCLIRLKPYGKNGEKIEDMDSFLGSNDQGSLIEKKHVDTTIRCSLIEKKHVGTIIRYMAADNDLREPNLARERDFHSW